jgi:histidyl-tRNA synthetase
VTVDSPDFWVAPASDGDEANVVRSATSLRRLGASVEYALRGQQLSKQRKAAASAGAAYFVTLDEGFGTSNSIRIEELGERGTARDESPLMMALAKEPATLEALLTVLRNNPTLL